MRKMSTLNFLLFILGFSLNAQTEFEKKTHFTTPHVSTGIRFSENLGQWDSRILFKANLDGGALYIEKNGLTFSFYDKKKYRSLHAGGFVKGNYKDLVINTAAYKVNFLGCENNPLVEKAIKGTDYENFFLGNDRSKWKGNVQNYKQVFLKNLYSQIDYEIISNNVQVKYNFHVKPGGDISKIKFEYIGVKDIKLKKGKLYITTPINEIIEDEPVAYQTINGNHVPVLCKYKLSGAILTFELPKGYDKNYPLIIDPVLVFAAQSGSYADNFGMTATYDQAGNLYSGGTVFDNGYPTVNSYTSSFTGTPAYGNTDIVITKYNSTGNALLYSTYLGGTNAEAVSSLIVDSNNNIFMYGATSSANYPVTSGSYDQTYNGGSQILFHFNGLYFTQGTDIFVSKLSSGGNILLGSTYVGGAGNDGVNYNNYAPGSHTVAPCGFTSYTLTNAFPYDSLQYNYGDTFRGEIQLDKNGNVYVTSCTKSNNFPTVNPFQNNLNGKQDAVVFKINNTLTNLIWSTYLGGSGNDAGYSLIVDDTLQTYVTGGTYSSNFPTTPGCHQTTYSGGKADGFITKLSSSGNTVLKSSFIGTSSYDQSFFVQSDRIGRIYVFGQSGGNMPVSAGIYSNPGSHQFIRRYDNQLSNLNVITTVIGSGQPTIDISPSAFSVDKCSGMISLTGWGGNFINCSNISGMPITNDAFQSSPPNGHDFYFMVLNPNFTGLKYGTYFGGALSDEHVDGGTSRISETGVLYQSVCAGCGGNDDFPVTPGAWPCVTPGSCPSGPNFNPTNCNNGVVKFDYQPKIIATIASNTIAGCLPLAVTFTNLSSPGLVYVWNLGGGPNDTTSMVNPIKTYTNPGTYTVTLLAIENQFCNTRDSTQMIITVHPLPSPSFSVSFSPCSNTVSTINNTPGNGNIYAWNFGDASPTSSLTSPGHTYSLSGTFTISMNITSSVGCAASSIQTVSVLNFSPGVVNTSTICHGNSSELQASGGTNYTWTPSSGISNPNNATITVSPSVTTMYSVTIVNNSTGQNCTETLTTQVIVYPKPTAAFNLSVNPCGGGVYFTDLSSPLISSWQWTLAPSVYSGQQNPYHFYANGGTNTVTLIVTTPEGCKDTVSQPISVPVPPAVAVSGSTLLCKGSSVQLNASGGTSYQWSPAASLDFSSISSPNASPTITTQYSVVITTSNNCSFLLTTNVNVYNNSSIPVSASASPPFVVTGNSTTLTYLGSPGFLVTWLPPGSTTPPTGYTVTATPDKPTTYTAIATNGPCNERAVVFVEAYTAGCIEKDAFVPNTFTPNGDGNNDVFIVRGLKVEEIYFAVYNRWGELVFETTDKTKGWDGLYKGRPADVGVFGWYLKVKCFNGEETFRKGNVTLIR